MTPQELFEENQAFAVWVANKYQRFENIEDLRQQAFIGLFRATKTFDKSRGLKFTTYAYPFIWREVFRFLEKSSAVHVPRNVIENARAVKKVEFETMSIGQIAKQTGLTEKKVKQALDYMTLKTSSTDEPVYSNEPLTVGETIASNEEDWDNSILYKDLMKSLDAQEKIIVTMRLDGKSQDEISTVLNVSQMQVSRLLKGIKGKFESFIA